MRAGIIHQKRISFTLETAATAVLPSDFLVANSAERPRLRLIAETKESYFVLDQPKGEQGELPYATLYEIPRRTVVQSRLQVLNVRSEGGR